MTKGKEWQDVIRHSFPAFKKNKAQLSQNWNKI
jgi:hypothetical protein